jgi:hypothetical protein
MTFEQIVCLVFSSARVINYRRERHSSKTDFWRIVVTLEIDAVTVDRFHNSASGYRAQYFCGVRIGETANRYAVKTLLPRVMELIAGNPKHTCPHSWIKKSLDSAQSKLWIHQGRWLRHAKREDRYLRVQRWMQALASEDISDKKKAKWGCLAPSHETKIVMKGAFVNSDGIRLRNKQKPSRSRDIRNFGFS